MPRARLYTSNAERQAAYRARLAERRALADSGELVDRVVELEAALAAARRREEAAERRVTRAECQAADARDRYTALLATRPDRIAGAPSWAKDRLADQLAAALQRVAELEATVVELQHRGPPQRRGATGQAPLVPTGRLGAPRTGTEDTEATDGGWCCPQERW